MTPEQTRPPRLHRYTSADAKAHTAQPHTAVNARTVVRGEPGVWAHDVPRPCQIPPDQSGGDTSTKSLPSGEDGAAAG